MYIIASHSDSEQTVITEVAEAPAHPKKRLKQWAQKRRPKMMKNNIVEEAKVKILNLQAELIQQQIDNKQKMFELEYRQKQEFHKIQCDMLKKRTWIDLFYFRIFIYLFIYRSMG